MCEFSSQICVSAHVCKRDTFFSLKVLVSGKVQDYWSSLCHLFSLLLYFPHKTQLAFNIYICVCVCKYMCLCRCILLFRLIGCLHFRAQDQLSLSFAHPISICFVFVLLVGVIAAVAVAVLAAGISFHYFSDQGETQLPDLPEDTEQPL